MERKVTAKSVRRTRAHRGSLVALERRGEDFQEVEVSPAMVSFGAGH